MKISFIGAGNMGEAMLAMLEALLKSLPAPHSIFVSDISDTRLLTIEQKYSGKFSMTTLSTTNNNREAVEGSDLIVLAIKPQNLAKIMAELSGLFQPNQLVLSIIAGASLKTLSQGLQHRRIVRAMPNTPARIGQGISVWTATTEVTPPQQQWAKDIIGVMGPEIFVDDEKYLNMATAVSGSGPAYLFYFVEALTTAAIDIGLPREMAEKLVLQTILGSGQLLQESATSPSELRRMVTSPGGTTAAAIQKLEEGNFTDLIKQAINAAYRRAEELGS
ncbi:pyrroline-5-carboxylate reductase [Chloroflexota bacterium]